MRLDFYVQGLLEAPEVKKIFQFFFCQKLFQFFFIKKIFFPKKNFLQKKFFLKIFLQKKFLKKTTKRPGA